MHHYTERYPFATVNPRHHDTLCVPDMYGNSFGHYQSDLFNLRLWPWSSSAENTCPGITNTSNLMGVTLGHVQAHSLDMTLYHIVSIVPDNGYTHNRMNALLIWAWNYRIFASNLDDQPEKFFLHPYGRDAEQRWHEQIQKNTPIFSFQDTSPLDNTPALTHQSLSDWHCYQCKIKDEAGGRGNTTSLWEELTTYYNGQHHATLTPIEYQGNLTAYLEQDGYLRLYRYAREEGPRWLKPYFQPDPQDPLRALPIPQEKPRLPIECPLENLGFLNPTHYVTQHTRCAVNEITLQAYYEDASDTPTYVCLLEPAIEEYNIWPDYSCYARGSFHDDWVW